MLHFTNAGARGGAEEHVLTLLRGLDRARFDPLLLCTPETLAKLAPDLPAAWRPCLCACGGRATSAARVAARRPPAPAARGRPALAPVLQQPLRLPAGPAGGVPVIVETPHVREQWRSGWLKSRFVVDRLAGRFVDRYIAVSEANARYLIAEKRLPARKVTVIANGCDVDGFDPTRPAPAGLRAALGFGAADPVLLVVGRLEPQKGHAVLLAALPMVRRRIPNVRLVCLGEGGLRGALEAQAASLGLADAVRFVGFRAPVHDWFALADVTRPVAPGRGRHRCAPPRPRRHGAGRIRDDG